MSSRTIVGLLFVIALALFPAAATESKYVWNTDIKLTLVVNYPNTVITSLRLSDDSLAQNQSQAGEGELAGTLADDSVPTDQDTLNKSEEGLAPAGTASEGDDGSLPETGSAADPSSDDAVVPEEPLSDELGD